ncbi:MAG TPA: type II toxin-antitoxin system HipA family toxin [Acidimicrobiales bacterium]|nr:type II toxin-antitoxin system HipA family toxin [Acidimicrobiales bacterium]
MSGERLEVLCEGAHVGVLENARNGLRFTYGEEWQRRDDATPLSVSMPLTAASHPPRVVEPFCWGLLPDNADVLARWGREFGVSVANPFGLLTALGEDVPGAMQFVRDERISEVALGKGDVEWLSDGDVGVLLRAVRRDHTAWLGAHREGRWSLAGAQAKIALFFDGQRWGRPSGRFATTHILKPAITGLDDHDLNEHICLRAARLLKLRAVASKIEEFDGERSVVVQRYDRELGSDGRIVRIHQEDLCQATATLPSQKYQSDGGPGPADIVRILRDHMPYRQSELDVGAFVDALVFNWLIGAPDAHAKNYALLLSGRQVRLAPFFDIASALPYPEFYPPKIKLAMKIGGYYRPSSIGRHAWERLATELRLDPELLVVRVRHLVERAPDVFSAVCAESAITELDTALPDRLLDQVASRSRSYITDLGV